MIDHLAWSAAELHAGPKIAVRTRPGARGTASSQERRLCAIDALQDKHLPLHLRKA